MLLLSILVLGVCSYFGWKIAAASDQMEAWEGAFGGLALGPIGLALVAFKCRPR